MHAQRTSFLSIPFLLLLNAFTSEAARLSPAQWIVSDTEGNRITAITDNDPVTSWTSPATSQPNVSA